MNSTLLSPYPVVTFIHLFPNTYPHNNKGDYFKNKHGNLPHRGTSKDRYRYHKWNLIQRSKHARHQLKFGFVTGHQKSQYTFTDEFQKEQLTLKNLKYIKKTLIRATESLKHES